MTAHDHVAFLAGSPNRVRVLRAIREDAARQCVLVDRLSLSRSTVQRCLRGFIERGWAHKDEGRFRITPGGAQILTRYDALTETIDTVDEHGDLLDHLRDLAFSLPPAAFADATVISASADRPHAPETRFVEALETPDIDRFRGITPAVSEVFNQAAAPLVAAGVDMELIIDAPGLHVSRAEYSDALEDGYDADTFDLYVHPEDLGFGLVILDDRVLLTAYDDDANRIRGCLDNIGDPFVEWATGIYDEYRHAAVHVEDSAT